MYLGEPVTMISFGRPCEVCDAPSTVMTCEMAPHYYCSEHNPVFATPTTGQAPALAFLAPQIVATAPAIVSPSTIATSDVWAAIERFRAHLRATGRESDDDVILEVMDYLGGFCGPIPGRGALRDRRAATAADSSSEP